MIQSSFIFKLYRVKKRISVTLIGFCFSVVAFGQIPDVLKSDGISAEMQGQYEAAAKAFEAAANAYKQQNVIDTVCIYRAGYNYVRTGQYEKAIPFLQESVDLGYHEGRASRLLSDAYAGLNEVEKAEAVLLTGKANCPEEQADFDKKLAYLYYNSGQYGKAAAGFEQVNAQEPGNRNYMYLYGYSLERIKRFEEAAAVFKDMQRLFPGDKRSRRMLGLVCFEQTDALNEKEVNRYEQKKNAKLEDYLLTKRKLDQIKEGYEEARVILEESLSDYPDDQAIMSSLYTIYKKQSKGGKASEMKSRLDRLP